MDIYVMELIKNNKEEEFVNNFRNIMSSCHIYILREPKVTDLVIKHDLFFSNIDLFYKKYRYEKIKSYIDYFYNIDKSYVENNIFSMLKFYKSEVDYIILIRYCKEKNIDISKLFKYIEDNNIILENNSLLNVLLNNYKNINIKDIELIINYSTRLLDLKYILKENNTYSDLIDLVNKRISNNKEMVSDEILTTMVSFGCIKDDIIRNTMFYIVKELSENEKINYSDICILSKSGAYSTVYQIGDKVIKIGRRRDVFTKINNKRFLQPLYRDEVLDKDELDFLFCIEITEKVDTNNITKEDAYQIYKELRAQGLIWTDCKEDNLGRLLKDNKVYFRGIDKVDKGATGYVNDIDEVLKKGDLVIIDNDYIYETEDYYNNNYFPPSEYFYEFEERYQSEIKLNKM